MIDPATTISEITSYYDNSKQILVMSDEFNIEGRGFASGQDPLFEALEKPDFTNEALQFYNASTDYVTTSNGNLVITTRAVKTSFLDYSGDGGFVTRTKNYTSGISKLVYITNNRKYWMCITIWNWSGMIQSWNKFCFTGGILEMSIRLPGKANSGGRLQRSQIALIIS